MENWKRVKLNKDKEAQYHLAWYAHRLTLSPEIAKILDSVIDRIWAASPPVVPDQRARVFVGLDQFINTGYSNQYEK